MNIILFSKHSKGPTCINISQTKLVVILVVALVLIPTLVMYSGYQFGRLDTQNSLIPEGWEAELQQHRSEIKRASQNARENLNALAVRLGQLQAQTIRLNALGERLVKTSKLTKGEFDFSNPPAQGGPLQGNADIKQVTIPDFLKTLDDLAIELDDREQQLQLMESFYIDRNVQNDISPAGRPIKKGWISSFFGMRADPFTGLQERHKGMDFAGKENSDVIAVATGVVIWSGDRYGYGNMVEVNHGNGYITRYAHNNENLVQAGDTVKQGQLLARMGSSGRSTGPHVHFEVLYKGKIVNPAKFIYAAR